MEDDSEKTVEASEENNLSEIKTQSDVGLDYDVEDEENASSLPMGQPSLNTVLLEQEVENAVKKSAPAKPKAKPAKESCKKRKSDGDGKAASSSKKGKVEKAIAPRSGTSLKPNNGEGFNFKVTFVDAQLIQKLMKTLKQNLTNAHFHITNKGIFLQNMDTSHVCLISLTIVENADGIAQYQFNQNVRITLTLESLNNILASAKKGDQLTLVMKSADAIELHFHPANSQVFFNL